jgi:hypothetical protein
LIWTVGACSTRATLTHRPRPSAPDRPPGWPGSRPPATSVSRSLSPGWPSPHARRPGWLAPAVLQSSRLPSLSLAGWLSCSVSPLVRFLLPLLSPYPFHRDKREGRVDVHKRRTSRTNGESDGERAGGLESGRSQPARREVTGDGSRRGTGERQEPASQDRDQREVRQMAMTLRLITVRAVVLRETHASCRANGCLRRR